MARERLHVEGRGREGAVAAALPRSHTTPAARSVALAALAGLGLATPTAGQEAPRLVDIAPCIAIESAVARLDCYDSLAARAAPAAAPAATPAAVAPAAVAPATAATAPAAPASAAATNPAAASPTNADPPQAPAPAPQTRGEPEQAAEFLGEVAALREIQPARLEITLTNGEVWRQTSSDRYRLQVGHEVRIYRGRFSDQYWRLTAPALKGFVQVERVR